MASKKPKLKKDTELLTRLHRNTGLALDATVKRIVDANQDIPAAIASASVAYLKLHGAAEEIEEEAREEAQDAAATYTFTPRIPLEDLSREEETFEKEPLDE